jgi:hypothetical protein
MSLLTIVLIIAGMIIGLTAVIVLGGWYAFDRLVDREVTDLSGRAAAAATSPVPAGRIALLPEPVRRYLEIALPETLEPVRFVRVQQTGMLRGDPEQDWMPLSAEQYNAGAFPAFIWHARLRPLPFIPVEARDIYDRGRGNMLIKLFFILPVADATGPEMDVSSLLRYLGEMPWFPTAFLNEDLVRWEAVDASRARATITGGNHSASAFFSFDAEGRITEITSDERYRSVGDEFVRSRWTGYYRDYEEKNGFLIPTKLESVWNLPGGDFSAVRLRVDEIEYDVFSRY